MALPETGKGQEKGKDINNQDEPVHDSRLSILVD
jgi:hypothetical protein